MASFIYYNFDSLKDLARIEKNFDSIYEYHKYLNFNPYEKIDKFKHCIEKNHLLLL